MIDAAYCYRGEWRGLSVTTVSPAKAADCDAVRGVDWGGSKKPCIR